jgi:hypothetical protein
VARATGFDTHKARWHALEKRQNLSSAQASVENDFAISCGAVNLKGVLGQIQADGGNLHGMAPLSQVTTPALWRIVTPMEQEPSTPSAKRSFAVTSSIVGFADKG